MTALTLASNQSTIGDKLEMSADAQMQLIPAFYDLQNDQVYISRSMDGNIAPIHVYDSLPDDILMRNELNVVSGFLYNGRFVTGDQAYYHLSDLHH